MSKIPYTGKTPGARQPARPVSADPLAAAEDQGFPAENPLLEDPDALADRLAGSEEFVRRNRNIIVGVLVAAVAVVAGVFGYYYWRNQQNEQAQNTMFRAVNYWAVDSLGKAMNGDGKRPGLVKVTNEYSGTKAANLAQFYAGVASLKQGKYQQAYDYLDKFSSDDYLVQSRVYSLMGDAKSELKEYKEAADLYEKAATRNTNEHFTPIYLMKEGINLEAANDKEGAGKVYDRIINDYQTAQEATDAKQRKAML